MRKLSAEDLVRYQSDGVVHLKGVFDKEWLSKDPLMSGVQERHEFATTELAQTFRVRQRNCMILSVLLTIIVPKMRAAFAEAMEKPGKYAEFVGKNTTWETLFTRESGQDNIEGLQMFQDQLFYQEILARAPGFSDVIQAIIMLHGSQLEN